MLILSFGDLHVGTQCDDDVLSAGAEIVEKAKEILPDLIVINGDLYDASSNPEDRDSLTDFIIKVANVSPTVIIRGNHDARKELRIMGKLAAAFPITVYEYPGALAFPDEKLAIHFLPWMTKSLWIAAEGISGIQAGNEEVSLMALTYLRGRVAENPDMRHVLFGHLMIQGALAENHQPLLGDGISLGYHDLVSAGFSAGACGHIHKFQIWGDSDAGEPEFRYNGSIAALDYGESEKNKGFSVLDTATMSFTTYQLHSVPRINIDAFWNGELNWSEGLPTEPGARVKVKLLIDEGYLADAAEKAIRESPLIVSPLELKIERQSRPRDAVRAAEIAAAKSATDKLVAYWTATNTTPEEPLRSDLLRITNEIETECLLEQ